MIPAQPPSSLQNLTTRYNNADWINDLGFVLAVLGYTTDSYSYRNQPYDGTSWPAQVWPSSMMIMH